MTLTKPRAQTTATERDATRLAPGFSGDGVGAFIAKGYLAADNLRLLSFE